MATLIDTAIVAPSGDTTGATDTAAIQAAINGLARAGTTFTEGAVLLSGHYYVNAPLVVGGGAATTTVASVSLLGWGHALIEYKGDTTSDYVLRYFGESQICSDAIRNITIDCNMKARGLLFCGRNYIPSVSNLYVQDSREVGIDAIDCWAMSFNNIHVHTSRGFCMRLYQANAVSLNLVRLQGTACYSIADPTNNAISYYAMDNAGLAAAATEYGADYGSAWPATDDTYCVKSDGNPYQTADSQRCGLLVEDSHAVTMTNMTWEGMRYIDYPIAWLKMRTSRMNQLYLEGNQVLHEKIILRGDAGYGRWNVFDGISISDGVNDGGSPDATWATEYFLASSGAIHGNTIRNMGAWYCFTEAIVNFGAGAHTGNLIERIYTEGPYVPNSATTGGGSHDTTFTTGEPPP